ncbi:iron hydrogenase small subunit [Clostridiaceae bacterium UIB06]|uniref:Iron hydrogenase small subunit n=1 Tax=Clostridium thailandense TaxID=2794346 RepID=A0A949X361_9CLOT|nr:[FeFe] hydrogenase, group A [Clostridium thailandense]MBV7272043.1 iron hydrogenase small subunit [Clostridium thailandense]MCH5137441.1 iron hydrogenase small subunit [Clostridiaceae bacterium UIB06]
MSISIVNIDKELCTGCRRCSEVCPVDAITGEEGKPQSIDASRCVVCGQCVQICSAYASSFDEEITSRDIKIEERGMLSSVKEPLFAAYNIGHAEVVKEALNNSNLYKLVQCAPAVRVAIAEEFGLPLGSLTPGKMAAALRRLNFDRVYDTNFAADLTIMEEGSELIKRVTEGGTLPMFTSCCPAWVKFAEQEYPELLDHLSSCKSPQQMGGVLFKTYGAKIDNIDPAKIFSVSIMPCTCKKFECDRPEMTDSGYKDVDVVLTTRELAQLIKDQGIDFKNLPDEEFDSALGNYTGAGTIFGVTGGVMEAALRTGYELITKEPIPNVDLNFVRGDQGVRTANVQVGSLELKVAVVSGLKNVVPVLEKVKNGKCDFHFIEVMTCPEGCVSGGGQPKLLLEENREIAYKNRKASTYEHDSKLNLRKSHENPDIVKLYDEFLGEPLGHQSHNLLHTEYISRKELK